MYSKTSKIKGKINTHIVHPIIIPHPLEAKFMSDIDTPRNKETTSNRFNI
jgi:hypothetical protein